MRYFLLLFALSMNIWSYAQNQDEKTLEVSTLKNICAKNVAQLLIQDIIKPEQVAYYLPIELIALIKDHFPQKAFIEKSPLNKYLDGVVVKVINERFIWLKNHERLTYCILDMKTKIIQDIKYHFLSFCIDPIYSFIIGSDDNKIALWDLKNNKQYPIINTYNLDLEFKNSRKFHAFKKFLFPYVAIDDISANKTHLYFLHLHDNDSITLELMYITGKSYSNIIFFPEKKALIRASLSSDLHPTTLRKYLILNQYNLTEKEWLDYDSRYIFSKDKKLIAYKAWDELHICSLDSTPDKEQFLPVLTRFKMRGSKIKFLGDSSYILAIPNLLTQTPTVNLWHWPTKQLINTLTFNCDQGIHRVFVLQNYVEFMDFRHVLHRMNVDFIKAPKIKKRIDECTQYLQKSIYIKKAQCSPILPAILKTSAALFALSSHSPLSTTTIKDSLD